MMRKKKIPQKNRINLNFKFTFVTYTCFRENIDEEDRVDLKTSEKVPDFHVTFEK
jgi:hypothetical protein|tara:strand:+ start:104 stop:268 length:165 start_codon:yes stop_codon:yes gene_type:complete